MEQASVTLLGVKGGPAISPGSFMPTSTLVQMGGKVILVDAGLGAAAAVCRAGVSLTAIDAILITHLHSDHYLELGPLLHTAWTAGLKTQLPIYGPSGLPTYWEGFCASMAYDIDTRIADEGRPDFHALFPIHLLDETIDLAIGTVQISAMRNLHPPVTESYALRLETKEHIAVLSGDTAPMDSMATFAKDADLLVHEAMLVKDIRTLVKAINYNDDRLLNHILRSHSPAEDVARIATKAGVNTLALNHLIPNQADENTWRTAIAPYFGGTLLVGRDGMEIDLATLA